jgi:hypothetical protein
VTAATEDEVRDRLHALPLASVKQILDQTIERKAAADEFVA